MMNPQRRATSSSWREATSYSSNASNKTTQRLEAMAIHLDDKMGETLTYDVGLGVGGCHLYGGSFTL
jgi:hypothetical protein